MKTKTPKFRVGDKVQWRTYPLRNLSSLNPGKREPMVVADVSLRKSVERRMEWYVFLNNSIGWMIEDNFMSYKDYSDEYDKLFGSK